MFYGCGMQAAILLFGKGVRLNKWTKKYNRFNSIYHCLFQLIIGHIWYGYWFKLFKKPLTHDATILDTCIYTTEAAHEKREEVR